MLTFLGLLFTFLWSTAPIAVKFGLESSSPLTLATLRFLVAGGILLLVVYGVLFKKKIPLPKGKEWFHIIIIGVLNTTIYLGASFWALNYVSAGFFNLVVTTNPFLVASLSIIFLNRKMHIKEWVGMGLAAIGIVIATYPSLSNGYVTLPGIAVLLFGMLAMAIGSVYFKKVSLQLPAIVINTWQVLIGGILLIPFTLLLEGGNTITLDRFFIGSLLYLIVVISIGTMLLWFYLLKQDAVKANNWLFLTPIFGYILAALFLQESVTTFDMIATLFVLSGLYLTGNIILPSRFKLAKA